MQRDVARRSFGRATFRSMKEWKRAFAGWQDRARAWKEAHKARTGLKDEDTAAALTELRAERYPDRPKTRNNVARGTVNSWLNARGQNVNLVDFLEWCEVVDADPRFILFNDRRYASITEPQPKGREARLQSTLPISRKKPVGRKKKGGL